MFDEGERMSSEQELIKEMEASPEGEIIGVVGVRGVSGVLASGSGGNALWSARFGLSGWKLLGGELRTSELMVLRVVPHVELRALSAAMRPYDVVRVRARWSEHNVLGSSQALLVEFIGKYDSDSELNAYALKLQEPVTFMDWQFGLFTLNRRVDWYEALPDWCDGSVRLRISAAMPDEMEKSIEVARQLWSEQEEWQQKIATCAAKGLLQLKNDTWLDEDEQELTEEDFANRMTLESISVKSDGTFEFWHDDGDLFLGHAIMVSGNLTDGPTNAAMHG